MQRAAGTESRDALAYRSSKACSAIALTKTTSKRIHHDIESKSSQSSHHHTRFGRPRVEMWGFWRFLPLCSRFWVLRVNKHQVSHLRMTWTLHMTPARDRFPCGLTPEVECRFCQWARSSCAWIKWRTPNNHTRTQCLVSHRDVLSSCKYIPLDVLPLVRISHLPYLLEYFVYSYKNIKKPDKMITQYTWRHDISLYCLSKFLLTYHNFSEETCFIFSILHFPIFQSYLHSRIFDFRR